MLLWPHVTGVRVWLMNMSVVGLHALKCGMGDRVGYSTKVIHGGDM